MNLGAGPAVGRELRGAIAAATAACRANQGGFPFVAPPPPQRLSAPFWAGKVSQLSASVDEEPFDIDSYYEEHHEGFLPEEAGDKMRGVTDGMILAGKNK